MTDTDITTEWNRWVDKCPLRVWRHARSISILRAAATLDVTTTTIQQWERGAVAPTEDNMTRLAALLDDEKLAARWARWRARRPTETA